VPADIARAQFEQDALLQRAAADLGHTDHTGPVGPVDFRGIGWD
jgi:hypothetical protein